MSAEPLGARTIALAGATAGVALSPAIGTIPNAGPSILVLTLALAGLIALRSGGAAHGPDGGAAAAGPAWIALLALVAACAGLLLGSARLAAIDRGALHGPAGTHAEATGFVTSVPRRYNGIVRIEVQTAAGRLAIQAPEPVPDLAIGSEVRASGDLTEPDAFLAGLLARHGIAEVLDSERIEQTGRRRGGLAGAIDAIRTRAERALGAGMPEAETALARGFVLGEDDRIDEATRDDFKRSGLAHLLAVSGENVILLAILAMPFLALAGLPLRARLIAVLVLIAIYVPVTGGGPSIQRAGAMGAAGVLAALAGRPSSRGYAVLLAAFVTLALNPLASGDAGWQLSFAAVIGIMLWARRLASLLPGGAEPGGWRRALAEGAAVTISATVATAPLMAHDFDSVSIAALPANLLVLPAVAPVMWLGMLAAAGGQAAWIPVAPLNAVNGLLLGYVEQVAHSLAAPGWALAPISLPSTADVLVAYAALFAAVWLTLRWAERRRQMRAGGGRRSRLRPAHAALVLCVLGLGAGLARATVTAPTGPAPPATLRVSVLDVGQGDAILLDPPRGDPVLVDCGPPGDDVSAQLADHGVQALAAIVVTHDESDHAGGCPDVLARVPVRSLVYASAGRDVLGPALASGATPRRISEGDELRSGGLRLEVLWPPRDLLPGRPLDAAQLGALGTNPNELAIVAVAEWKHFSMLLTADAEAEAVPLDPGPVDVLKVAHHGSDDAGLASLLESTVPDLAVISVGAGNSYGHPTEATLATLREHQVPVVRTDLSGTIEISADRQGWSVSHA